MWTLMANAVGRKILDRLILYVPLFSSFQKTSLFSSTSLQKQNRKKRYNTLHKLQKAKPTSKQRPHGRRNLM